MWLLALVLIDNVYTNPGTLSGNTLEKRGRRMNAAQNCSFPLIMPVCHLIRAGKLCSADQIAMQRDRNFDKKECLSLALMPEGPRLNNEEPFSELTEI